MTNIIQKIKDDLKLNPTDCTVRDGKRKLHFKYVPFSNPDKTKKGNRITIHLTNDNLLLLNTIRLATNLTDGEIIQRLITLSNKKECQEKH